MKKDLVILDDTCLSNAGGTALTLRSLSESITDINFQFIETRSLTEDIFNKIPKNIPWVLGNITNINRESLKVISAILQLRKFVKIEFDYGFCRYRCEQGFKNFTGKNEWNPFEDDNHCNILKNIYLLNRSLSYKIFYMSKNQMDIHNKMMPFSNIQNSKQIVLGSCFSPSHLMFMINKFYNRRINNKKYAIVDGNGGWHSKAKGVKESIDYAKKNNLDYEIIKSSNYENFLNQLSSFHGCIFLPIIHDTCPRLTIEAKMMGLTLITNSNSQHVQEDWFRLESQDMGNYLLERPSIFRKEIEEIL